MSQAGKRAGITGSSISHIEQGRMNVSADRIRALVRAYGYSMDDFQDHFDGKPLPVSFRDECIALLKQIDESKLQAVHTILINFRPV